MAVYLDNAATTPLCAEAAQALWNALGDNFYNPSALYAQATLAAKGIDEARGKLKALLHAADGYELYFTSGGTEANNTALFGAKKKKGARIIVGEGEHDSVIAPAKELQSRGYDVRFAPIDSGGRVDINALKELLSEDTALVSVMHVSNETGGINDIASICRMTKRIAPNALVHSDGVQAFLKMKVNLPACGVDMYSVTAHKVHGPKGIGALVVKKGASVKPLLFGGGQEMGFRSGTESLPLISSFCAAATHCATDFVENYSKIWQFREYILNNLLQEVDGVQIITPIEASVPHILTVALPDVRGEVVLHELEKDGIFVGIGSACASHHESRFKKLLGLDEQHRDGILRLSFSEYNDISEADFVLDKLSAAAKKLRSVKRV